MGTVCYHAQQLAEKALKAHLVFHRASVPRTRDLLALLARGASFEPAVAAPEYECRTLNAYAVGVRYPAEMFDPDEMAGRDAYLLARRIYDVIASRLLSS